MFNRTGINDDYEVFRKLKEAKADLAFDEVTSSNKVVLESLDDVFFRFEKLVNSHPSYSDDLYSGSVSVKDHLSKTYGSVLADAIESGSSKKVHCVCFKISELYVPKDIGFVGRFLEKRSFVYALKSYIKDFKLSNSK